MMVVVAICIVDLKIRVGTGAMKVSGRADDRAFIIYETVSKLRNKKKTYTKEQNEGSTVILVLSCCYVVLWW